MYHLPQSPSSGTIIKSSTSTYPPMRSRGPEYPSQSAAILMIFSRSGVYEGKAVRYATSFPKLRLSRSSSSDNREVRLCLPRITSAQ